MVLGDVGDVERLHGVFDVLGIHVVNLTDVAVPEEKQTPSQPIMQNEMKLLDHDGANSSCFYCFIGFGETPWEIQFYSRKTELMQK